MYRLCEKYKVVDYAASHLHHINKRHVDGDLFFVPDT